MVGPLHCSLELGNGAFREKVIVKQFGQKGRVNWKKYFDDVVLV